MARAWHVSWAETEHERSHVLVSNLDALESVLDSVELSAMLADNAYELDIWMEDRTSNDPILLQVLVGHPERSSILWHEDGTTIAAITNEVAPLEEKLECISEGRVKLVEPSLSRVTAAQARDFLTVYFLTGSKPDMLQWHETEQD